jgi:hypothetical protein
MDPGIYWEQLMDAKRAYPSVPVIAVVNPDNGSGSSANSTYADGITEMQKLGIFVLGYVDTVYTNVSASSIEGQISDYHDWYKVNGIFLDDMPSSPGDQEYYAALSQYAYSLGMDYTVGNPGTLVSTIYVGSVNNLMIYEEDGLPLLGTIEQYAFGGPAPGFSMIATQVNLPSQQYIDSLAPYVSYVWFTNYSPDYMELPSAPYLDSLMAECAAAS